MNRATLVGAGMVGLLALAGCGGDDAAPEENEPSTEAVEATEGDTPEQQEAGDASAPEAPETPEVQQASVGDTFPLMDAVSGAEVDITFEAFDWITPEYVEGEENYGVAIFTVDARESEAPVDLLAPIDGGGWSYTQDDGTTESLYNMNSDWSSTYDGRSNSMHSGPFSPGTQEKNLVREMVVPERGGMLTYVLPDGQVLAELEVPDESVNEDHEAIQEIYEIGDEFGGEVASKW